MTVPEHHLDALPSAAWDAVDRIVDAFEQAWRSGTPPALVEFLPADASLHMPVLVELVHVDLEHRLKADGSVRVERYLEQHPELTLDRQILLSLAVAEFRHRRRLGAAPEAEEYGRRFPQLAPELARALETEAKTIVSRRPASGAPPAPFKGIPPGSRVGDYEILALLGRGGMGVVYKAFHRRLKRTVALKMILGGPHAGDAACDRFRVETEAVARLHHPNIVLIYEVGDWEGLPFFAMELVEGQGLDQKLAGKPLPPAAAAELAETLARAIHYAHQRGVIHRDLKPANILVSVVSGPLSVAGTVAQRTTDYGLRTVPKITDFGLAKQLDADTGVTPPMSVMGTPGYMAPEIARGHSATAGASVDVYALGAVLYEMLTGRPPFCAATAWDTIMLVATREPVPPSRLQPGCPRDLETICLKCLTKDPRRRYAAAFDLAEDLRRFQAGEPIQARPAGAWERTVKWARRRPLIAALTAALALALTGGIAGMAVLWLRAEAARDRADRAKDDALWQKAEAEQSRRLAEERLLRLQLSEGVRLQEDGDLFAALPWFVAAVEGTHDATAAEVGRTRIACVLRQCPRLVGLWPHRSALSGASFSPNGRLAVTTGAGGQASLWDVQTGKLVKDFPHDSEVIHAAFSPDGRLLVTASRDNEVQLWDAASDMPLGPPLGHQKEILDAAFSANSRQIVTASADGTARVWDAEANRGTPLILRHDGRVRHAAFSPDGRWVATGSDDRTARLWDASSGKEIYSWKHDGAVTYLAFGAGGRKLVTVGEAEVHLWDVESGREATALLRPGGTVHCAEISPNGELLLTAGADQATRLWDIKTGRPVGPPLLHGAPVVHATFSPDGRMLATASADHTARVWHVDTQRPAGPRLRHNGPVRQVLFSPDDGHLVLTVSDDRTARLWETGPSQPPQLLHHEGPVRYAAFGAEGRLLVTVGDDGCGRLWDGTTGKPHNPATLQHPNNVVHAAFNPAGTELVTAGADNNARHWDIATGQLRVPMLEHEQEIQRVAFSPDGRLILTGGEDGVARLWSAATDKIVAELPHGAYILHTEFSPDGRLVVTAGTDRTARIWQVARPDQPPLKLPHEGAVLHASFSPDGSQVVTASADGTAQVWDVSNGEKSCQPCQHGNSVLYAEFSPNGQLIATAGYDGIAQLWHATGGRASPPLKHDGPVRRAVFSPDGRLVATASADRTARVWEVSSGLPVTPRLQHRGEIWHIAFSPDGCYVVTAAGDSAAYLWDIRPDERPVADMLLEGQLLSGQHLAPGGGIEPIAVEELYRMWQMLPGR